MTKLKTLKDIEAGMSESYDIFYKNLKSEAIKWVKECLIHARYNIICKNSIYIENKCLGCRRMIEFANITEADLQEKK